MGAQMNRRQFLATAMAAAGPPASWAAGWSRPKFRTTLKRALIVGEPTRENLQAIKTPVSTVDSGTSPRRRRRRPEDRRDGAADPLVIRGWAQFNSDNQRRWRAACRSPSMP